MDWWINGLVGAELSLEVDGLRQSINPFNH
jgi:hypothetical protein